MTVALVGTTTVNTVLAPRNHIRTVAEEIGGVTHSDLTVKGVCLVLFAFFHPSANKDSPYPT